MSRNSKRRRPARGSAQPAGAAAALLAGGPTVHGSKPTPVVGADAAPPASVGERVRIAVIVHTLNEARNIVECLEHLVGYADDVLVVDMYSDDDTVELAERAGARVLLHERIVEFDFARNWSAQQVAADWVFYVDADERVPAQLWTALRETLPTVDPSVGGLCLPYRNFFEGRWMQCLYPGYKAPMLLRAGRFVWRAGMHEGCRVDGQVALFQTDTPDLAIDHFSYPSFESYIRKSYLTYVPAEVLKLERSGTRFDWQEAAASFGRDLAHYYDQRAAWRDGGEGLSWSLLSACYRLFTHLALYEQQKGDVAVPSNAAEIVRGMLAGVEQVTPASPDSAAPDAHAPDHAPSIVWSSPLLDPSGYADEARNFVLGLERSGTRVKANPITWNHRRADLPADEARDLQRSIDGAEPAAEFVHVQHVFPTAFQKDTRARATVGRTMFETDRIPDAWVAGCNALDEIWVPSDFNLETFAASGVERRKLKKVPGSLDRKRFERYLQPLKLEGARGFNFLSVFDWTLRKGWDVLLRAYVEEFRADDDVCLFIKTHSSLGHSDQEIVRQIESFVRDVLGKDLAHTPQIRLLTGTYSDEQMLRLYRSVDAYVMPSRGEGWGRPLMDAMASGLPTIGTGWSGNTEFMTTENSYLIDYELAQVAPSAVAEAGHFAGHRWAEPSVAHLRSIMREVVADPSRAKARGARARAEVLEKFDRSVVASIIAQHVQRLLGASDANQPKNLSVAWEGSQFVYHSLAHVNREVCLDLAAQPDIDLSIVPYESHAFDAAADPRFHQLASRFTPDAPTSAAVHVRHQWPPRFEAPRHGAWVMIQPWEFGGLPAEWIAPMRDQVDEIWVPSEWVRDCYIRSGIPAEKVVVIPNGVDTSLYRPDGRKLPLSTRKSLKLLFLGGTIGRKGIDVLLNTYLSTFTAEDDVCLVIKSNGTNGAYRGSAMDDEIRRIAALPNAPEIELIADDLSDADVAALYRACDVLVHPYRGEGFGMPIAEAMASGLPVVVTNYGACLDFCDDEVGYLIPARLVEIPVPNGLPAPSIGYWWAEPNQVALGAVLREIVRDPSAARTRGAAGVRRMQSLTWKHVGARVRERLRVLADRTPLRFGSLAERAVAVEPLPLDGRRGTTLLLEPCWSEAAWEQALIAFGRTYGPQDDVTLVVRLDPAQGVSPEAAAARFEDVLRAAGLDPDHAPDVLLVPDDLDARGVQRLHAAANHRLPPGPAAVEMLAKIAARRDLPRAA